MPSLPDHLLQPSASSANNKNNNINTAGQASTSKTKLAPTIPPVATSKIPKSQPSTAASTSKSPVQKRRRSTVGRATQDEVRPPDERPPAPKRRKSSTASNSSTLPTRKVMDEDKQLAPVPGPSRPSPARRTSSRKSVSFADEDVDPAPPEPAFDDGGWEEEQGFGGGGEEEEGDGGEVITAKVAKPTTAKSNGKQVGTGKRSEMVVARKGQRKEDHTEEDVQESSRVAATKTPRGSTSTSSNAKAKRILQQKKIQPVPIAKRDPIPPASPSVASTSSLAELEVASEAESALDQDDDEEEEDSESEGEGRDGKKQKKGVKITTDRLRTNKGKLNAVDVIFGRVAQLLRDKTAIASGGKTIRALQQYSALLQTSFLVHSDQLSTLAKRSAQVSSARGTARRIRTELLAVQRDRAKTGRRLSQEEEAWKTGRKRVQTTRDLHSFLGDLNAASVELRTVTGGPPQVDLLTRLTNISALIGGGRNDGKKGQKLNRPSRIVGRLAKITKELEEV
ncbi:hypothetical protein T439DRAFT_356575 [Meredithblackwellia eburnea MCA 4105]